MKSANKTIKILFLFPNSVMQNPPPVAISIFYALLKDIPYLKMDLFDTTLYDTEDKSSDKTKEENLQVRPFNFSERKISLKKSNVYDDFLKKISAFDPDVIALSCNEVTAPLGLSLLNTVKEHRAIKIAGGVYPTFAPDNLLKDSFIDFVCIGEGESFLMEFLEKLYKGEDLLNIKNLCYRKNGRIIRNPLRPPENLHDLPLPDYDIFEQERYYRPMSGKVWKLFPIETNRGCPFNCSYCNSPSQDKLYKQECLNTFFRKKDIEKIGVEIEYLVNKYKAEYIYFLSDTLLCMSDDEFDRFCKMYNKYRLPFWCQNRPEMINLKRAIKLKEIGCHRMSIGVEHGNEEFRKNVLKKHTKNETILKAFDILDKAQIPVSVNNIIGFPGETRELAFETINLNRKLKFDTSNAYAFVPFRGTELYDECIRKAYISRDTKADCLTKGSVLNMPEFPKEEIDSLIKTFSLYAKMPEKYFDRIRIAEKNDQQGQTEFKELSAIYKKLFFYSA